MSYTHERHLADIAHELPVIPTMDVVVFPNMIIPLLVVDKRIITGVEQALKSEHKHVLLLASQQAANSDDAIGTKDLYTMGTVATIMRTITVPDGGIKVLVQGVARADVTHLEPTDTSLTANITPFELHNNEEQTEITAHINHIRTIAEQMVHNGQAPTPDFHATLGRMEDPHKIIDFIVSNLSLKVNEAQNLLETRSVGGVLEQIGAHLTQMLEIAEVQENIKSRTRESMNKAQKEFYLREQLRAIKQELGDDASQEIDELREKIEKLPLSDEAYKEVSRQLQRLEKTSPDSMEASVIRTYLEWIVALPWGVYTEDNLDVHHANTILEEDHYGLESIKEAILDFLSVKALKPESPAPILCFVGPPGTGKTSLGQSIARALGRTYHRIALGGIRDEGEIRGHRRTYVGALPGRFIQGIHKAGSMNPVIVIDELDKIGDGFRGDPSAALLEVLDPQQNSAFYDNYIGLPFDLSHVIFIATANDVNGISAPLRDRMEVVDVSGYTPEEKYHIADRHLIRRACNEAGIEPEHMPLTQDLIDHIVRYYTRESGVRQLSRVIKTLCSKTARMLVEQKSVPLLSTDTLHHYLGPSKYSEQGRESESKVGITNGLAWTQYGGELITIEAVTMPGNGNLLLTGKLGEVMKESAQAALSYIRSHAHAFEIPKNVFTDYDIHVHIPAGAVPKDGPSAGVTILASILSTLTQRPINAAYAMTGEINLQGKVMPIGGVKEKILAAKRNGIHHVLLPHENKKDATHLENLADGVTIQWVSHADEIIQHVLTPQPSHG